MAVSLPPHQILSFTQEASLHTHCLAQYLLPRDAQCVLLQQMNEYGGLQEWGCLCIYLKALNPAASTSLSLSSLNYTCLHSWKIHLWLFGYFLCSSNSLFLTTHPSSNQHFAESWPMRPQSTLTLCELVLCSVCRSEGRHSEVLRFAQVTHPVKVMLPLDSTREPQDCT